MDSLAYTGRANLRIEDCCKYWGIKEPKELFIYPLIMDYWNTHGEKLIKRVYEMKYRGEIECQFNNKC